MAFWKYVGDYTRLARLHSAVLTALTPVFGALAMDPGIDFLMIMELFLLGLYVHGFGFILNEYFDLEVDKRSGDLTGKPLVSGAIKPQNALISAISAVVMCYIIIFFIAFSNLFWPLIFITLTLLIFFSYDKWGKTLVIADVLLAGYVGFLCIAGASVIGWPLNPLAIIIAVLAFGQLFLQNALANLKDVENDKRAGANTTAIRLGVMVSEEKKSITITKAFAGHIWVVKIIHILFVFGYLIYFTTIDKLQFGLILIVVILMVSVMSKILTMRVFHRERLLRLIGAHELITYSIIPLLFINILSPLSIILLIIFPVIWLAVFMKLMYGRLLPNI